VVRPREPHHFEGEDLCAEVPHVPKHEGKIDLPEGERLDSRYDPVEWCRRPPSADRGMPISSSVDAYSMLISLPPSIRTLWILQDLNRGDTTSG
jgi:hypothetical protein